MQTQNLPSIDCDDELIFAAECDSEFENTLAKAPWKILIVDDETEVHEVTKLTLSDFTLEEKSLTFLHAYSAEEARQLLQIHPDIAIILLDVVMETEDAGLQFVKYIREILGNHLVRIILRTGQPGQAPEKQVVVNYGIDDYKTKTELTSQKLFISVVTALRSFSTLMQIVESRSQLEREEAALRHSETELRQKTEQLEQTVEELRRVQTQLVQSEKMSSLGQLVAGIAHEINNPINFIFGNLSYAYEYSEGLLELISLYQQHCPHPPLPVQNKAEEIELPFLCDDLPKLLQSMQVGAERIREIIHSLRVFSRLDESEIKAIDIHEGINSTLMILQNRLKAKASHSGIQVVKEYGSLPLVECYAGQLNQVFMNILSNAIDALEERKAEHQVPGLKHQAGFSASPTPFILIRTERIDANWISIKIFDNGPGMSETAKQKLFNSFFTTKEVGKGTGMGLVISHQIVTEKHRGRLSCSSILGKGTEFAIEIPIRQLA